MNRTMVPRELMLIRSVIPHRGCVVIAACLP